MKPWAPLVESVAAYARRKMSLEAWSDQLLLDWIEWYHLHKLLIVIHDGRENVIAFAAARPTTKEGARDHNAMDWEGDVLAVDFFAANNAAARAALWKLMLNAMRPREWIGYCRNKYRDRVHLCPFERFTRTVTKLP